jgi:hypothetical protein
VHLPVEQTSQLELVDNLATAKALGLSIPQAILLQAGQLIDRVQGRIGEMVVSTGSEPLQRTGCVGR